MEYEERFCSNRVEWSSEVEWTLTDEHVLYWTIFILKFFDDDTVDVALNQEGRALSHMDGPHLTLTSVLDIVKGLPGTSFRRDGL